MNVAQTLPKRYQNSFNLHNIQSSTGGCFLPLTPVTGVRFPLGLPLLFSCLQQLIAKELFENGNGNCVKAVSNDLTASFFLIRAQIKGLITSRPPSIS
jgi:hypothetical protein